MFSSVITKNLNWKILTKNLVTFEIWDELKMKKLNTENFLKIFFKGDLKNNLPVEQIKNFVR